METLKLVALSVIVVTAACGCATAKSSVGNKAIADQAVVAKIEKGKSRKADVKALLGDPMAVDFTDAGFEKWLYMYTDVSASASAFGGGSHAIKTSTLTVQFDKEGVVQNVGGGQTTGGGGLRDAGR